VNGSFQDPPSLEYLRAAGAVAGAVSRNDGLAVLDLLGNRWFQPAAWRETYAPGRAFDFATQVSVIVTDDPRYRPGMWMHTRGMKKFGRPDVQIRHIPARPGERSPVLQAAADALNAMGKLMAMGGKVVGGQSMSFPRVKARVSFLAYPDDSGPSGHFQNASIQVVDLDPATGAPTQDLSLYLTERGGLGGR